MWEDFATEISKPSVWVPVLSAIFLVFIGLVIEYRTGFFSQRKRKELSFRVLSETRLDLDVVQEIQDHLQILFKERPVESGVSIQLKITNTGNLPIASKDYETPIRIGFGDTSLVYWAIQKSVPSDLGVRLIAPVNVEEGPATLNELQLQPILLNKGDSFTIAMLVDGYKPEALRVGGRIIGTELNVTTIEGVEKKRLNRDRNLGYLLILILMSFFIGQFFDIEFLNYVASFVAIIFVLYWISRTF